jgi:Putative transposase/Transposase zinc-binding domain
MKTQKDNTVELADVFRKHGEEYLKDNNIPGEYYKVMYHITHCRTAAMGGHILECDECNIRQNAYNSCRDRHCPKCQTMVKEKWLNDRKAELLPCGYFHNVFTLPHLFNPVICCNKEICFDILFASINEILKLFAKDPQWRLSGQIGFIGVLHTWSQTLMDHFHLHCLIPAGVLSFDKKKWIPARKGEKKYLFKIGSLAKEFKKRYLKKLRQAYKDGLLIFPGNTAPFKEKFEDIINQARCIKWVAYTKRPFTSPEHVLEYLGRYTHRVAITNNRIKKMENGQVTFSYKDRKNNNAVKDMILPAKEFIRRFLLHVLPNGFMKIRYYGFLARTNKKWSIPLLRSLIDPDAKLPEKIKETIKEMMLRLTGKDITLCPECNKGKMVIIRKLPCMAGNST